jgi:hypothetical protein
MHQLVMYDPDILLRCLTMASRLCLCIFRAILLAWLCQESYSYNHMS